MPTSPSPAPVRPSRESWIDLLRGTGVIVVMLVHASSLPRSFASHDLTGLVDAWRVTEPFRMPLMMFLAGMFLGPALRKGAHRYVTTRLAAVAWPYLVWSVVVVAVYGGLSVRGLMDALLAPRFDNPLWFLWFLGWFAVLAVPARRAPAITVPALLALSAVLPIVAGGVWPFDGDRAQRFVFLLAVYVLGDTFARHRDRVLPWLMRRRVVVVSFVAAAATALAALRVDMAYQPIALVGTLGGIVVAVAVARRIAAPGRFRAVVVIGQHSMVLYLTHYPVLKITAVGLRGVGLTDPWLMVAVSVAACLVVASATIWASARWASVRLPFAWPLRSDGSRRPPRTRPTGSRPARRPVSRRRPARGSRRPARSG